MPVKHHKRVRSHSAINGRPQKPQPLRLVPQELEVIKINGSFRTTEQQHRIAFTKKRNSYTALVNINTKPQSPLSNTIGIRTRRRRKHQLRLKMGSEGQIERKPRFLCLHGFRTSGQIMKTQIGKWPNSVLDKMDLVYVDAPFPCQGKSDVEGIFDPPYYEWFQFNKVHSFLYLEYAYGF